MAIARRPARPSLTHLRCSMDESSDGTGSAESPCGSLVESGLLRSSRSRILECGGVGPRQDAVIRTWTDSDQAGT